MRVLILLQPCSNAGFIQPSVGMTAFSVVIFALSLKPFDTLYRVWLKVPPRLCEYEETKLHSLHLLYAGNAKFHHDSCKGRAVHKARVKFSPQVARMLQAMPGRGGKQQPEHNSPNLGTVF